jgi:hypothetical protein
MTLMVVDDLEAQGVDIYAELRGFITTSDGKRFRSKPQVLRSRD